MSTLPSDHALFGGKELAVVGEPVWAITLDSNVVIYAGSRRDHEFRIGNSFTIENPLRGSSVTVRYDPYNRTSPVREYLTELSAIIPSTIIGARAYVDGHLELSFDEGSIITVLPLKNYEAWAYTFGNFILACPPGGFATAALPTVSAKRAARTLSMSKASCGLPMVRLHMGKTKGGRDRRRRSAMKVARPHNGDVLVGHEP